MCVWCFKKFFDVYFLNLGIINLYLPILVVFIRTEFYKPINSSLKSNHSNFYCWIEQDPTIQQARARYIANGISYRYYEYIGLQCISQQCRLNCVRILRDLGQPANNRAETWDYICFFQSSVLGYETFYIWVSVEKNTFLIYNPSDVTYKILYIATW